MSATIICVGANHRTAGIAERETFFLEPTELEHALPVILKKHHLSELMVLSTCNRFELVAVSNETRPSLAQAGLHVWMDLHAAAGGKAALDLSAMSQMTYTLAGQDAIRHAFMVASSLDSLIPGETQITGQFKDAVQLAQKAQTLGPLLARLSQEVISATKKVRSQTDIGKHTVSISHAAVTLAKRMFHDLSTCRFLVIGAGEMARVAAEHAKSYQPKKLSIANRTANRAYELAQHVGSTEGHSLGELAKLIADHDVVIAATSSSHHIITKDIMKEAHRLRGKKTSLFLVDISLPRNIDPECSKFDDVYLFDIDDLKQVVDQHLSQRQAAAKEAEGIINSATSAFDHWLSTQAVVPVMEAWRHHVHDIISRETRKTLAKDLFAHLDDKQKAAIISSMDAVTSRLSSELAQSLRTAAPEEAMLLANAMRRVFSLEQEHGKSSSDASGASS